MFCKNISQSDLAKLNFLHNSRLMDNYNPSLLHYVFVDLHTHVGTTCETLVSYGENDLGSVEYFRDS